MPERSRALRDLVFVLLGVESEKIGRDDLRAALREWNPADPDSIVPLLKRLCDGNGVNWGELESRVDALLHQSHGSGNAELPTVRADDGSGALPLSETLPSDPDFAETLPADAATLDNVGGRGTSDGRDPRGSREEPARSHRFRVIEEHAKGGLGVVFRALDGELNREVALKQIQERHADNPSCRSRFLLEAEVTGGLEHPGIVPVYGLGLDEHGRPYYAMRFIRGDSLRDAIVAFHADPALRSDPGQRSLELRKLLRCFLDVCNTVDYAHGRGVLHRDIKPANIMVGKHGETLVVDWGIAKVGGRPDLHTSSDQDQLFDRSHSGATETLPGSAMGTPAYMSPEQAEGDLEKLAPESDVYSLGATLYAILVGRPAFEDTNLARVLAKVKAGTFPPPRKVDRSIPAALEAICLKAMSLQPSDRYHTARALADDVERWMADEPVLARRDPWIERVRRGMRRHRTSVTAASAAVLVAMAGLVVVLAVQRQANHDLRLANEREHARFDLALEAIGTFHTGVSGDFLLRQDEFKEQRVKLLSSARDFYRKLEHQLIGETDAASRRALGQSYFAVGELTSRIGTKDEALISHNRAREIREDLALSPDATVQDRADLASSLFAIAAIDREQSRFDEAETLLKRALNLRLSEVQERPGSVTPLRDLAWCHHLLGDLYEKTGQHARALASYTSARAIRLDLVQRDSQDSRLQFDLAASYNTIGRLLTRLSRPKEGMEDLQRAREIRERLVASNPEETDFRDSLARSYHTIALQLARSGQMSQSLEAFQKSLDLRESLIASFPAVSSLQTELAAVASDMAVRLYRVGQGDRALAAFERSRDIEQRLHRNNPSVTRIERNLALSLISIGIIHEERGRTDAALASFEEARGHLQALADAHPDVPDFRYQLAGVYAHLGRVFQAGGRVDEALWAYDLECKGLQKLADGSPQESDIQRDLSIARSARGEILSGMGMVTESLRELTNARRTQVGLATADPRNTDVQEALASTLERMALVLARHGDAASALTPMEEATRIRRHLVREHPGDLQFLQGEAEGQHALGEILHRLGQTSEAVGTLRVALMTTERQVEQNVGNHRITVDFARVAKDLGDALRDHHLVAEAASVYRQGIATLRQLDHLGAGGCEALAELHAALAWISSRPEAGLSSSNAAEELRALDALRDAVAAGYRDVNEVLSCPEYRPFKNRAEFQAILADMAFPLNPFLPPRAVSSESEPTP
ncbi:MAG: serine/threonine-protein kinase [Isosphaeraceae bacterium]